MHKYSSQDTVGCGINFFKREIFFTYNGQYFGPAFKDIDIKEYYATIGLHSLHQSVKFNFGQEPFKFNLKEHILKEQKEGIRSILDQEVHSYDIHQIVHSYLYFNGYFETLQAFEKACQFQRSNTYLIPKKKEQH